MDGKELKELSDLWFFFHLDKKGDDWVITERTVTTHGLQRLQKTRGWGVSGGESESRSVSCEDIVWGFLDQLTGALSPPLYMTVLSGL